MNKIKEIIEKRCIDFVEDPASKLFSFALNLFLFACSLTASIWLVRIGYALVLNAVLR